MRKIALLICNSNYKDKTLNGLVAPNQDASSFAEVLKDSQIGQFDDVKVLSNKSSQIVQESVAKFYNNKKRDDLLLLYFTGHGILDENGHLFLAVSNTNRNILRATSLSARFITEEMDNCRSCRQILLLDCCHSGAFSRGAKGSVGQTVGTGPQFEGSGYGRVVLTATDAIQYAWEGNSISGKGYRSLFTENIVQGLRTGDADINKDGVITVDDLYDYVYEKIIDKTNEKRQTPGKWSYKQEGKIVLVEKVSIIAGIKTPPSDLWNDTIDEIVNVPNMYDPRARQAIILMSFNDDPIRYQIDFSGSSFGFVTHLLHVLINYGCLKNGKPAISELLDYIRNNLVGSDQAERIGQLIEKWNSC